MRAALLLAVALSLSGCMVDRLNPPAGKTPQQVDADAAACRYEGVKAAAGNGDSMMGVMGNAQVFNGCMHAKGY